MNWRLGPGLLSAWAAALLLAVAPNLGAQSTGLPQRDRTQTQAKTGSASIVGHVFASDSGRPVRLARILVSSTDLPDGGRVTLTDQSGSFEFTDLPPGRYTISASKTGFIEVNLGQRRPLRSGRSFELRDGDRLQNVDFRLPRGSVITGQVTDQDGEPLVRASVRVYRYRYVQGERQAQQAGSGETDDRGRFRVYDLPPGTYIVSASARSPELMAVERILSAGPGRGMGRGLVQVEGASATGSNANLAYAPTYYPGVPSVSEATAVDVPLGQEVGGVDFMLQLVTAARVTGTVVGANGVAPNTMVMLVPEGSQGIVNASYSGRVERDGSFSVLNVPPGSYLAIARGRARRGEPDTYAVEPVTVVGPVTSGVSLALTPGVTLTGQVTFDGASAPSPMEIARIRIGLWAPVSTSIPLFNSPMNTTPRPDGTFSIADVPAGHRRFRLSGLPQSWALKAIYLDGRDVTDVPIEVRAGETGGNVNVVLTDRGTEVAGTVSDEDDQPATDYTVIAFSSDSTRWYPQSRFIAAARPDASGTFRLSTLPPGEYLLQAIDDVDQGEWYDPALLEALRQGATRVVLQEGDKKSQDLRLVTITR